MQIITNTPVWVWVLLALLIYRGAIASVTRDIALKRTLIIPIVMLGLSVQGIAAAFGANPVAMATWAALAMVGSVITWQLFRTDRVVADPSRGIVRIRGSWTPLILMMGIFFTKYAIAVTLAMKSGLRTELTFVIAVCALYGIFNGIFIGQALRVLSIYRDAVDKNGDIAESTSSLHNALRG